MHWDDSSAFLHHNLSCLTNALSTIGTNRHKFTQLLHGMGIVLTHRITDRFVSHRITQTYIHRETHFLTNALSLNGNGFYFN